MPSLELRRLKSNAFLCEIGTLSSASSLLWFLNRSEAVDAVRKALSEGRLPDGAVRRFADRLLREFVPGRHFAYDHVLAVLAVALDRRRTDFAEEFLLDLARLNISEIRFSPIIARTVLKQYYSMPRSKVKRQAAGPLPSRFEWRKAGRFLPPGTKGIARMGDADASP